MVKRSDEEIATEHRKASRKMLLVVLVSLLLIGVVVLGLLYLNDTLTGQATKVLSTELICDDNLDNDLDGDVDCDDSDCLSDNACSSFQVVTNPNPIQTGPTSELLGYWNFENTDSTTVYDGSGKNNHGTFKGGAKTVTYGKAGGHALQLDGDGDYVNFGDIGDMEFGSDDFTIMAKIYPDSAGHNIGGSSAHGAIISKYGATNNSRQWWMVHTGSNNASFYTNPDGSSNSHNYFVSSATIPSGEWSHLTVQKRDGLKKIFINGVLVSTKPASAVSTGKDTNVLVGRVGSGSYFYFNGMLDDIRVYSGYPPNQFICDEGNGVWTGTTCLPAPEPEMCNDLIDNDQDGLVDCADTVDCSSDAACLPPEPVLLGQWNFNSDTMGGITDSSGASVTNDGAVRNGAVVVPGSRDGSHMLSLNGDGGHAIINGDTSIFEFGSDDYTIGAWVKTRTQGHNFNNANNMFHGTVISKYNSGSNNRQWWMIVNANDQLGSGASANGAGGSDYHTYVSSQSIPREQWVYVTSQREGNDQKLYLGGELVSTEPAVDVVTGKSAEVRIGSLSSSNWFYFNGFVDDVTIHFGAVSEEDLCNTAEGNWDASSQTCSATLDSDGDGFTFLNECNDNDAGINPSATEQCFDGVDNNCDGNIDATDSSCAWVEVDELSCADGLDNDNDGDIDCDDATCASACQVICDVSDPDPSDNVIPTCLSSSDCDAVGGEWHVGICFDITNVNLDLSSYFTMLNNHYLEELPQNLIDEGYDLVNGDGIVTFEDVVMWLYLYDQGGLVS